MRKFKKSMTIASLMLLSACSYQERTDFLENTEAVFEDILVETGEVLAKTMQALPAEQSEAKPLATNNKAHQAIPTGMQMKQLQQILADQGYLQNGIDGAYGPKTKQAIIAYQNAHALNPDGRATWGLFTQMGGKIPPTLGLCVKTDNADSNALIADFFDLGMEYVSEELNIDLSTFLAGMCLPDDRETLEQIYIHLTTEGSIHSRLATIKFNQLADEYHKAGIDIAVKQDGFNRSTENALIADLRHIAQDRQKDLSTLLDSDAESNDFQHELINKYKQIKDNHPVKAKARALLGGVLNHAFSSTFYLARSAYTLSQMSSKLDFDFDNRGNTEDNVWKYIKTAFDTAHLVYFLYDKKDQVYDMLKASTYNIRALTQDVDDIPTVDPSKAKDEVEVIKRKAGYRLDDMEIYLASENIPQTY